MDREANCWRVTRGFRCCSEGDDMPLLVLPSHLQRNGHDCAEAAVQVVLDFHGVTAVARFSTAIDGADPRTVEGVFRKLGFRVVSGEMTADDLKHWCGEGKPPIVLVRWPDGADSHYFCVRGISRGRVFYMDPESGPGSCPLSEFQAAWAASGRLGETYRGWAIVGWPG
jgi:ABC-type bacteriocin/lantibiotic exporter with double-glycine peptidase domain